MKWIHRRTFYQRMGERGEKAAQSVLKALEMRPLLTNFKYKKAEVDLIAQDGITLCFIEVKTFLRPHANRTPGEKLKFDQMKRIKLAAKRYLSMLENRQCRIRFDLIEVTLSGAPFFRVKHIHYQTNYFFSRNALD